MFAPDDPKLTAYVLGELNDAERAEVEAALEGSEQLRQTVEEIRRAGELLSATLGTETLPSLHEEQRQQIEQRMEQPVDDPVRLAAADNSPGERRRVRLSLIIAASLLLAVVGTAAWLRFGDSSENGPVAQIIATMGYDDDDELSQLEEERASEIHAKGESEKLRSVWVELESKEELLTNSSTDAANPEPQFGDADGLKAPRVEFELDADAAPMQIELTESPLVRSAPGIEQLAQTGQPARGSLRFSEATGQLGGEISDRAGGLSNREGRPLAGPAGTFSSLDERRPADSPSPGGAPSPVADPQSRDPGKLAQTFDVEGTNALEGKNDLFAGRVESGTAKTPASGPTETVTSPSPEDGASPSQSAERGESRGKVHEKGKRGDEQAAGTQPSWRRDRATPNASRLMIGDRDDLPLEGMQVNVRVDGFRARVLLDCYYYNNHSRQLEGSFKLRLPDEASLYYFAFGETSFEYRPMVDQLATTGFMSADLIRASGLGPAGIIKARNDTWSKVKEARLVPRKKAAHAYSEVVRRRVDPALVEWSGAGVFNARVFPLMPNKLHRIVIGYDVNLKPSDEDLTYQLDLPSDVPQCVVDLDVSALPGATAEITPAVRPFVSNGRAYYHFQDPREKSLHVRFQQPGTILLEGKDEATGDFFATRFTPDIPAGQMQSGSSHAVFVVDTSLSSNPDKFNIWLKMLETTLEKNRDTIKHMAVLFFNVETHWWKPGYVRNTPQNVEALLNYCNTLSLEGATDLGQALAEAASPSWPEEKRPEEKLTDAVADLFLYSEGAATWGETNLHRITRVLEGGSRGSLFAYRTGLAGTAGDVLEHLARESGGAVFPVTSEDEVDQAATAHRHRPWQLLNASVAGSSDILIAGRPRSIYPGQSLLLVGRGRPEGEAVLALRRGEERIDVPVPLDRTLDSELAPRIYGQVAVGQLEDLRSATEDISVAYARHFRVTGRTCSLLMLESENDYQRFGIKPEDDSFVVQSSPVASLVARKLDELAQTLDDAKAETLAWLAGLEKTAGFQFRVPPALRLALERLPKKSFEVEIPRLACRQRDRADLPKKFFQQLSAEQLDYEVVTAEARRRYEKYGGADALKAVSSLVERNPGDPVLTRDVAFSAMEWGLAGQAYPLLRRVAAIRPYEPQVYPAIAQCLAQLGNADLAMVYYEVALTGTWHARYQEFHRIAALEYLHLLRQIKAGELSCQIPEYAQARLDGLTGQYALDKADLVVTMMWNTDRTDVDLHVLEPSGEECFYKNPNTRAGGRITRDVTEGFGPEMYIVNSAGHGKYVVRANYYGSDINRTQVRTKVYVTVYEDFGHKNERITRHTVMLDRGKEKRDIASVTIEK